MQHEEDRHKVVQCANSEWKLKNYVHCTMHFLIPSTLRLQQQRETSHASVLKKENKEAH